MRSKPLLLPVAFAIVAVALLPPAVTAQVYPWTAEFGGGCVLPRGSAWFSPFGSVFISSSAPPESLLATFPSQWQGRDRIGIAMDMREPGMTLKFEAPTSLYAIVQGDVEFEPPIPWPSPVDSLTAMWPPLPMVGSFGYTYFTNKCVFTLFIDGPMNVTADATLNLVGFYASDVDTVKVWGTEFGWLDIQLHDQQPALPLAVEEGTWGRIKAYLLNGGR
jgi:hypothetical protein